MQAKSYKQNKAHKFIIMHIQSHILQSKMQDIIAFNYGNI